MDKPLDPVLLRTINQRLEKTGRPHRKKSFRQC